MAESPWQWPLEAPVTLSGRRESQATRTKRLPWLGHFLCWDASSQCYPVTMLSEGRKPQAQQESRAFLMPGHLLQEQNGGDLYHSTFTWPPWYLLGREGNCRSSRKGEHLPNCLLLVGLSNPSASSTGLAWSCRRDSHSILEKNEPTWVAICCKIMDQDTWGQSCLLL